MACYRENLYLYLTGYYYYYYYYYCLDLGLEAYSGFVSIFHVVYLVSIFLHPSDLFFPVVFNTFNLIQIWECIKFHSYIIVHYVIKQGGM